MNSKEMHNLMRNLLVTACLLLAAVTSAAVGIGTWKNYLAYSDITDVQQAGNTVFVLASGGLYTYNTADQSIVTYDKTNALSDCGIQIIAWCQAAGRLVIVYDNGNIDLMTRSGDVDNMPDYYNSLITEDKTINGIDVIGSHVYMSTGFGVVDINVADREVTGTYNLGFPVNYVYSDGSSLYAASESDGIYSARMSSNMLDPGNWTYVAPYTPRSKTVDPELLALAETLAPGGPRHNTFYCMKMRHGRLYTSGGFFLSAMTDSERPGTVQVLDCDDDEWQVYQENLDTITGYIYRNVNCLAVDPSDPEHVFAGGQSGMYEFRNGRLEDYFNRDNSILQGALDGNTELGNDYTFVHSVEFSSDGTLWLLNSQAPSNSLLSYTQGEGFAAHDVDDLMAGGYSFAGMIGLMEDSRGLMWFVNNHFANPAMACFRPGTNEINVYHGTFVNQNGAQLGFYNIRCITEDIDGNIWIGTDVGPFYMTPAQMEQMNPCVLTQYVVPRNDGTNYGDYLLSGTDVTAVAVDDAGRKWIGTNGNGVYLISRDNNTQLEHFTAADTPLLSDNIESIAIDGATGEVFFGTDMGLCSYMSDATTPNGEMTKDNVYAYPNPVKPGYTGLITVTGLSFDADVKIVTSNGVLVAEGRSTGGTFTWDGCDLDGRPVASGMYMVMTATSAGDKGTVCKIAIVR